MGKANEKLVLFDGSDLSNWRGRHGAAAWTVKDGYMEVVPGTGDITSCEQFRDVRLHLEYWLPDMPEASGQKKANSGIFLQGLYEIQVLDSYGYAVPGTGDCGALYNQFAPLVNACRPAMEWQEYDIFFRAPRGEAGELTERARVTVLHNGIVIHNNQEILGPTAKPVEIDPNAPGPLVLQDHNDVVRYRNVWLQHLPLAGSKEYHPA